MEKIEVKIEKMECGGCAAGIEAFVAQIEGVKSVSVDQGKSRAIVEIDIQKTSRERIVEAIRELGYKAS